jgi:hypothetical protein
VLLGTSSGDVLVHVCLESLEVSSTVIAEIKDQPSIFSKACVLRRMSSRTSHVSNGMPYRPTGATEQAAYDPIQYRYDHITHALSFSSLY